MFRVEYKIIHNLDVYKLYKCKEFKHISNRWMPVMCYTLNTPVLIAKVADDWHGRISHEMWINCFKNTIKNVWTKEL